MSGGKRVRLIKEGQFVAEVEVELIEDGHGWSPCLSVEDAEKLDQVRAALKADDTHSAAKLAKVYRLQPIAQMAG